MLTADFTDELEKLAWGRAFPQPGGPRSPGREEIEGRSSRVPGVPTSGGSRQGPERAETRPRTPHWSCAEQEGHPRSLDPPQQGIADRSAA